MDLYLSGQNLNTYFVKETITQDTSFLGFLCLTDLFLNSHLIHTSILIGYHLWFRKLLKTLKKP